MYVCMYVCVCVWQQHRTVSSPHSGRGYPHASGSTGGECATLWSTAWPCRSGCDVRRRVYVICCTCVWCIWGGVVCGVCVVCVWCVCGVCGVWCVLCLCAWCFCVCGVCGVWCVCVCCMFGVCAVEGLCVWLCGFGGGMAVGTDRHNRITPNRTAIHSVHIPHTHTHPRTTRKPHTHTHTTHTHTTHSHPTTHTLHSHTLTHNSHVRASGNHGDALENCNSDGYMRCCVSMRAWCAVCVGGISWC